MSDTGTFAEANALLAKFHAWSVQNPTRPLDRVFNLLVRLAVIAAAYYLVADSRGKDTPGIDRETCSRIEAAGVDQWVASIAGSLKAGQYSFSPLREVKIPKDDGGTRSLSIPVIRDRVVERLLLLLFEPVFEPWLAPESMAFRPGRGPHVAIDLLLKLLAEPRVAFVCKTDIKAFYPSVRHEDVMTALSTRVQDKKVLHLTRQLLRRSVLGTPRARIGLSQGGPASPFLANLVADPIDAFLRAHPRVAGHVRYADDLVLTILGERSTADDVLAELGAFMATRGFPMADEKSEVRSVAESVTFLGHDFKRIPFRPVELEPSPSRVLRLENKLMAVTNMNVSTQKKIEAMTRIADGWTRYFRPYPLAAALAAAALTEAQKTMTAA